MWPVLQTKVVSVEIKNIYRRYTIPKTVHMAQAFLVKTTDKILADFAEAKKLKSVADIRLLPVHKEYSSNVSDLDNSFVGSTVNKFLDKMRKSSPDFEKAVQDVEALLKANNISWPQMYIYDLALSIMAKDFDGADRTPDIDFAVNGSRLITLLTSKGFESDYIIANKQAAQQVFKERLVPMSEAFRKYLPGGKIDASLEETILAGGDATRFLKMFRKLQEYLNKNEYKSLRYFMDSDLDKIWHELETDEKNKDLLGVFPRNTKQLFEVLNIPMFHFLKDVGVISLPIKKYNKHNKLEGVDRKDLQVVVDEILKEGANLPKAMVYAVRLTDKFRHINEPLYLNYAWIKIIRMYAEAKRSGIASGHKLNLMLKDETMKMAFDEGLSIVRGKGILDNRSFFDIDLLGRAPDSMVLSSNGLLAHSDASYGILTGSAGHGTGFIKATNDIKGNVISFQTIDNMGSNLPKITAMLRRALRVERKIMTELEKILKFQEKDEAARLNAVKIWLKQHQGYTAEFLDAYGTTAELLAGLLAKRWSYVLDKTREKDQDGRIIKVMDNPEYVRANNMTAEEVMKRIKSSPITVAMVVAPEPSGQKGGGLYLQDGTGELMIVDKFSEQYKGQKDKDDLDYRFNPMVFATYLPAPLNFNAEKDTVFISKDKPITNYNAGESASTHVATSAQVLKIVIDIPRKFMKKVFQQNKTIDETNPRYLQEIAKQVKADLRYMARDLDMSLAELYSAFYAAQEKTRRDYLRALNRKEEADAVKNREFEAKVREIVNPKPRKNRA